MVKNFWHIHQSFGTCIQNFYILNTSGCFHVLHRFNLIGSGFGLLFRMFLVLSASLIFITFDSSFPSTFVWMLLVRGKSLKYAYPAEWTFCFYYYTLWYLIYRITQNFLEHEKNEKTKTIKVHFSYSNYAIRDGNNHPLESNKLLISAISRILRLDRITRA